MGAVMAKEHRDENSREGSTDWPSTRKHEVLRTFQYAITKSLGTQGVSPRRVKILAPSCPPSPLAAVTGNSFFFNHTGLPQHLMSPWL